MRKSFIALCLFLIIGIVLPTAVYAADTTYSLDEADVDISLPSDYIVFTRDIRDDDPNLAAYGLTKEDLSSLMLSGNIYLDAWDKKVQHEILVTMTNYPYVDFSQYDDAELLSLASTFTAKYEDNGITCTKTEVYEHEHRKFTKIYVNQPYKGGTAYGVQYGTTQNGKAIFITLHSNIGTFGADEETLLRTVVDGAEFTAGPQATQTAAKEKAPFVYTDAETQASFTVGSSWSQAELFQDADYINAKFVPDGGDATAILYGSSDLWEAMSASEKGDSLRSDIDNSVLSKADIAKTFSVDVSKVKTVTLGGYDYYEVEGTVTNSDLGIDVSIPMIEIVRVENGYMYVFQYFGSSTHPHYQDFISLVASAHYPAIRPNTVTGVVDKSLQEEPQNSINAAANQRDSLYRLAAANLLLRLFLTIAIYSLPIFIYRYAIRKTPMRPRTARRVTVIYAICAFFGIALTIFFLGGSMAPGGAIFLWSFINYKVLTSGYYEEDGVDGDNSALPPMKEKSDASVQVFVEGPGASPSPKTMFCRKCGSNLPPESKFCNICGTKIE